MKTQKYVQLNKYILTNKCLQNLTIDKFFGLPLYTFYTTNTYLLDLNTTTNTK